MGNKELCGTCKPKGICIFEEAIIPRTLKELKGSLAEQKKFAEQIGCTRFAEVDLIIQSKKTSRKPLK